MEALERAIKKAGGVSALARAIGVSANAPSMWKARKSVPAEHCPAIEREFGVMCEELCPAVDWAVLRNGQTAGDTSRGAAAVTEFTHVTNDALPRMAQISPEIGGNPGTPSQASAEQVTHAS